MYLNDDGIRLHIELDRPQSRSRCPICLLLHGFTGDMEEPHILAMRDAFLERGIAVLRAELYGHGASDGAFRDHNLFKWLNNTLTLVDYCRSLDFVTKLLLCGHSQGGLTAMLAAAMEADRVDGLIPLSPAVMIPEQARSGILLGVPFDPSHVPDTLQREDTILGGNYIRVAQTIQVEQAIDRYHGPVLVIHGSGDETVPCQYGEAAAKRYQNGTFACIPGDTHCYDLHLDQAVEALKAWLSAHFPA